MNRKKIGIGCLAAAGIMAILALNPIICSLVWVLGSMKEQDANLENLIEWVAAYATRDDEYGLQRHQDLFE